MKNIFSILLTVYLISSFFSEVFAQSNSVNIKWTKGITLKNQQNSNIVVPDFDGAFHLTQNNFLPSYHLTLNGNVINFKISNEVYAPLEEEFKITQIQAENISVSHATLKQKSISDIEILTVRQNPSTGVIEKLISFEYSYSINNETPSASKRLKTTSPTSSVLATGDWYKLGFTNSGVYKIDYNYLVSIGITPSNINPKNIQIFGNGGGMLPQPNSSFRHEDLVENSIFVNGEDDQTFDNGDYILFYVQGPNTWSINKSTNLFTQIKNIYSDTSFYFLTIGNNPGARLQSIPELSGATQTFTTFHERVAHENDLYNILASGREWYGELFDQTGYTKTLNFSIPDLTKDSNLTITSSVMGRSIGSTSTNMIFDLSLNNTKIGTHTVPASGSAAFGNVGVESESNFIVDSTEFDYSPNLTFKYVFNRGIEPTATGYLNSITINAVRDLKLNEGLVYFRNLNSLENDVSKYSILNAVSGTTVWDISDPLNIKQQNNTIESDGSISFQADSKTLKEYVAFNSFAVFPKPASSIKIKNQNLRANNSTNLLIITVPSLYTQAERLANLRRTNDSLSVSIVLVNDIYNEFSSGAQDITAIRDFVRHLYYKGTNSSDSLKYLLLFGACSYDYKNRVKDNTNLVPVYEMYSSLNLISSQSSDDYYGFMDEDEGRWSESPADLHTLEIGIGRIPARNETEAEVVVNKLLIYADKSKSNGKWRNKITFVADAGDANLHVQQADKLAATIETNNKFMNVNRVFLDAYQFLSFPDGVKAPECNKAIDNAVNKGSLIVNYTGHGAETQLSTKKIVTIPQIQTWENLNNLPFFVTATCEVSRYDDPERFSAGELILLSSVGGGIGLLTSTRPVYSSSNLALNTALYKILFNKNPNNNQFYRIGDIIEYTKNNSRIGIDNRNYAILGDPSMRLNYPKEQIVLDSITSSGSAKFITNGCDTIKALEKITIKGSIKNEQDALISTYEGNVYVTYFDKQIKLSTLGQENGTPKYNFNTYGSLIYEGLATVKNGKFEATFVVPKDISYQIDFGRISLYAIDKNFTTDAAGYNTDIYVGGSNANASSDNTPPKIKLFINDETFVHGGTTNSSPLLIANLSDENGINITGAGVGHEITAILDNNTSNVIVLNKYYTSVKDNYQDGRVEYKISNLSPGIHTLKLKAWDSFNNSSEQTIEFVVANSDKIEVNHLLNYPNPFSTNTTFHFDHNKAGEGLSVQVQIFTTSGKLVRTLETETSSSNSHFSDLSWNGKDDFGDNIAKGVYVYKMKVSSKTDGSTVHKYEKLVILN